MYNYYKTLVKEISVDELERFIESIAFDERITNHEYEMLYEIALKRIQIGG